MIPEKIEIFIDDQMVTWKIGAQAQFLKINENQKVKVKIYLASIENIFFNATLDVEDYSIDLHQEDFIDGDGRKFIIFASSSAKIFRESFGVAILRVCVDDEEFSLPFDVLATKLTAGQTELMLRYLSERREHIIRVCLSRTMRPTGVKDDGWSDPEMVISTAEKIINTLLECRGELRQSIRSKLIPAKVPAWQAEKSGSLIDPVDVIFNLDSLRPGDGRQDVILRGRTYSTSAIDVTALVKDTNVEENTILIGGLYSIRRVILDLMNEIGTIFKGRQIAAYDKEYVRLDEMLIKLTGGAMYERCERLIFSTESLIRMFEKQFKIVFAGEVHPKITPFVRSSRLYRNIFSQYVSWYELGSPSIDGNLFLMKLRSLSKIFEFFVLFRLFDYLIEHDWKIKNSLLSEKFDRLVPDVIVFEKNDVKITMSYEPDIYKFSNSTQDMSLVKLNHADFPGKNWKPDYVMRIESLLNDCVRYIILDAKYSSPYWVGAFHLNNIYQKYYEHIAVFNKAKNFISRNELVGVFAIFPEASDQKPAVVKMRLERFGIDGNGPLIFPMVAGLPISFGESILMEKSFSKIIEESIKSMN